MQNGDGVFKVPRVQRKRVVNLYCNETLSDLDETWDSPSHIQNMTPPKPKRTSTASNTISKKTPVVSQRKEMNINEQQVPNFEVPFRGDPMLGGGLLDNMNNSMNSNIGIESLMTHDYDEDFMLQMSGSRNMYTRELVNEFTNNTDSTVPEMGDMDWVVPEYNGNLTLQESRFDHSEKSALLKHHEPARIQSMSPDGNITYTQDILLVRDESMRNIDSDSSGSDTDWDSLTPPVPGSPSDHRVPDMGGIDSPPYDNLYTLRQQQRIQRLRQDRRDDHEVPDFML